MFGNVDRAFFELVMFGIAFTVVLPVLGYFLQRAEDREAGDMNRN